MVVVILAAILAAILDFSVSSRIFACYPPASHYRGANDAKSTVKKTLSFQAGYTWMAPRLVRSDSTFERTGGISDRQLEAVRWQTGK